MSGFKIINNPSEITLNNKWASAIKVYSNEKIVDEKGREVSSNYKGRQYRIIEKRERNFSRLERVGRGLLGTIAVVCTCCLGLFSKSVRNLFVKSKEDICFGISESSDSPINQNHDSRISSAFIPKKVSIQENETKFNINSQGKFVYILPKLLFRGTKISENLELNFALVKIDEKQKLVPVTSRQYGKEYTTYNGTALEALLKIAQDKEIKHTFSFDRHYGSPIGYFLKHPDNSLITKDEFFKFILDKDEAGTPRLCTLNSASTLEVLSLIKEEKLPIHLNEKTPTGETLFTLWAGKGNARITKLILELDHSVIDQIQGRKNSAFVEAALKGSREEADLLVSAMEERNLVLSTEETWIKKAFKNDLAFSEKEFTKLDQELKTKIYFVANAFGNEEIVRKLKPLGMDTEPLFFPGPDIFAINMDIVTTRSVMENFLKDLRRENLLLTEEEFSKLDKNNFISKINQIGRIQGKNFIEKIAEENGLKHIKVPKKIAVVNGNLDNISFRVDSSLELIPQGGCLTIYAERVKPTNRNLSLEEAIEFMIILEKTGYSDFMGQNIFFCEDGIYFIDTEYKDFSPTKPKFATIKTIKNLVEPKDAEKFLVEYEKRKKAYDKEKKTIEAEENAYQEACKNPYKNLADGYQRHEFNFALSALV